MPTRPSPAKLQEPTQRFSASHHTLSRRTLLRCVLFAPLVLAAVSCGGSTQEAPLPSVSLDTFPKGLGRGFPTGTLVGADNSETGIDKGNTAPNFRMQI